MRRSLGIVLAFTCQTDHRHPHLATFTRNYERMLQAMELPADAIAERQRGVVAGQGLDAADFVDLWRGG